MTGKQFFIFLIFGSRILFPLVSVLKIEKIFRILENDVGKTENVFGGMDKPLGDQEINIGGNERRGAALVSAVESIDFGH